MVGSTYPGGGDRHDSHYACAREGRFAAAGADLSRSQC
jgi:hypothetical protein